VIGDEEKRAKEKLEANGDAAKGVNTFLAKAY
jgi:hypothetical protein